MMKRHTSYTQPTYPIKVNHLPLGCRDSQVQEMFSKYGTIVSLKVNHSVSESYAYVNFDALGSAQKAEKEMNGYVLNGRTLTIGSSKPKLQNTLKIVNVPAGVDEQVLSSLCKQFGEVHVKINPGSNGNYAYLNFHDQQGADRAYAHLNGHLLYSERLKVKWHSRAPPVQQCESGQAGTRMSLPRIKEVSSFNIHTAVVCGSSPSPTNSSAPVTLPHQHESPSLSPCEPLSSTVKVLIHGKGITPRNLQDIFIQYGTVAAPIVIQQGTPDFAYVNFSHPSEASQALSQKRFCLNGVTISVKPSSKQLSSRSIKESKEIQDSDPLVNLLMATTYLGDASRRVKTFEVIVRAAKNSNGLQISGDSEEVSLAECHLRDLTSRIKETITVETVNIHCKTIPVFANPSPIQLLAGERKLEFSVMSSGGQAVCLAKFCNTVASLSQGTDPVKLPAFSEFLTTSGAQMKKSLTLNVSWEFEDDTGTYSAMPHSHALNLESIFQLDQTSSSCKLSLGQWKYTYNFQTMKQTNLSTKKVRRIQRIAPSSDHFLNVQCRGLSGETQSGMKALETLLLKDMVQCTIPLHQCDAKAKKVLNDLAHQFCLEVLSSSPQQIVIKGTSGYIDKVALKLKEEALAEMQKIIDHMLTTTDGKVQFPAEWQLQAKTVELFPLVRGSTEWSRVEEKFISTMRGTQITSIERVQNTWLWEKYIQHKKMMDKKNEGNVNEMELFHGTRGNDPRLIYDSEEGFDMRYSAQGMWGQANYFAVNASYSDGYAHSAVSGRKQLFLAKVLTGDSHRCGPTSLRMPPEKTSSGQVQLSQVRYDTVTGHTGGSQVYMTYDNQKAYPAYLITYSKCLALPGIISRFWNKV